MTAERDHQAEQDHAEFAGWFEAQGYTTGAFESDSMAEAFTAGMQAARDLAGVAGPKPAPSRAELETAMAAALQDLIDESEPKPAPELAADLDRLRERVARTAAKLDADALVTAPSKKSEIQAETAARLRETLGGGA